MSCLWMGWLLLSGSPVGAQNTVTVVNGPSFRTDQPVSPGSWVSGFGTFPNVGQTQAAALPLPKTLGGVTITVAGVEAPINYVSSTQVNFVIPYGTPVGLHPVVVTGPGGTATGTVRVINAAPGLFKLDTANPPRGAILNQDSSVNAQDRPAIRGQAIQIFATGHSALRQPLADGAAGPVPAIETQARPQVFVGGVECQVEFSGLAPGFAALWQINARIPALSFLAGKLPVQVFLNGVDSNEVTIYVAP
ncbi:MAG TPA: IPT/TIG domain-containing protein [Terriglobia bacterium]|nr:IPT/TIG domain-containing protein [Terriglobia bacterium]